MTDAVSDRRDPQVDGPQRPPTFVQIRPPATVGPWRRPLGFLVGGLAVAMAVGWVVQPGTPMPEAPATPAPATADAGPSPTTGQPHAETLRQAIDAVLAAPAWRRDSVMDRLFPFDPAVAAREPAAPSLAETAEAAPAGSIEVSARLGKGETLAGGLHKLGLPAATIADVTSAMARHVSLRRLPIGTAITVQLRRPEQDGTEPILQELALRPPAGREIDVKRTDDGSYAVELR